MCEVLRLTLHFYATTAQFYKRNPPFHDVSHELLFCACKLEAPHWVTSAAQGVSHKKY